MPDLGTTLLALARGDGRHVRLLKSLARVELLILDDWGLATMTSQQGRDMLEIVDDRHGRASTIVTSQLPVDSWHDVIPDPTVADASSTGSSTRPIDSHSRERACASPPQKAGRKSRPGVADLTRTTRSEPLEPSTGAAVRDHRIAARDRSELVSAFAGIRRHLEINLR